MAESLPAGYVLRCMKLWPLIAVALCAVPQGVQAISPALEYHPVDVLLTMTPAERALAKRVEHLLVSGPATAPKLDLRLVAAARHLAAGTVQARDALHAAGVSDAFSIPVRYGLVDQTDPLAPVRSLLTSDVKSASMTHFGVGLIGRRGARGVGLVFVRRRAAVGRFPKRFTVGDRYLLTGTLSDGLQRPAVLMSTPGGKVREVRTRYEHGVFWAMVQLRGGVGRYVVEVQARGKHGTEVLNLLEVYASAAGAPLESPVVRVRPPLRPLAGEVEAEARALRLINHSRQLAGLSALSSSGALRGEARRHARDMATAGFFGHESPRRGALGRRLVSAGLSARVLARENIAIAPHPDVAHSELMRSPSHLRNILDPHVDHVGVGVHRRMSAQHPVYTITQIFARLE